MSEDDGPTPGQVQPEVMLHPITIPDKFRLFPSPNDWGAIAQPIIDRLGGNPDAGIGRMHGGNFDDLLRKVDHYRDLGVSGVVVGPVQQNVANNVDIVDGRKVVRHRSGHYYWTLNPFKIDPDLAPGADPILKFIEVIDAFNAAGMEVILDISLLYLGPVAELENGHHFVFPGDPPKAIAKFKNGLPRFLQRVAHRLLHRRGSADNLDHTTQKRTADFPGGLMQLNIEDPVVQMYCIGVLELFLLLGVGGFRGDTRAHPAGLWELILEAVPRFAEKVGKLRLLWHQEVYTGNPFELANVIATTRHHGERFTNFLDLLHGTDPKKYPWGNMALHGDRPTSTLEDEFFRKVAVLGAPSVNDLIDLMDQFPLPAGLRKPNVIARLIEIFQPVRDSGEAIRALRHYLRKYYPFPRASDQEFFNWLRLTFGLSDKVPDEEILRRYRYLPYFRPNAEGYDDLILEWLIGIFRARPDKFDQSILRRLGKQLYSHDTPPFLRPTDDPAILHYAMVHDVLSIGYFIVPHGLTVPLRDDPKAGSLMERSRRNISVVLGAVSDTPEASLLRKLLGISYAYPAFQGDQYPLWSTMNGPGPYAFLRLYNKAGKYEWAVVLINTGRTEGTTRNGRDGITIPEYIHWDTRDGLVDLFDPGYKPQVLDPDPKKPKLVVSVPGYGYRVLVPRSQYRPLQNDTAGPVPSRNGRH